MSKVIDYLKDPNVVAQIQKYYGVKVLPVKENSPTVKSKLKSKETDGNSARNRQTPKQNSKSELVIPYEPSEKVYKNNGFINKINENEDNISSESESEVEDYIITNRFWYYLFVLGTALGDEIFYASFIPFWFWNIDGAVGRRVVMVWTVVMYIGQGIKDIVRTPRPSCPPAVRLQKKWALEYGMPSTHAMVGMSIPFSVILYTMSRYQYSVPLGVVFAVAWCTLICMSRLYLGMHSLLDIVVGIILALLLMIPVVPLVDSLDYYLLTNRWSPIILLATGILLIIFYPSSDRWTPTRGDTTMIVSVCVGVHVGAWTNFHLGILSPSPDMPPYTVIWPTYAMLGLGTLRTILGFCCIVATRALCKSASYATLCALLRLNSRELKESRNSLHNREKIVVELSYTFITYFLLGFNTVYLLPSVFRLLGIERPTFYTEI